MQINNNDLSQNLEVKKDVNSVLDGVIMDLVDVINANTTRKSKFTTEPGLPHKVLATIAKMNVVEGFNQQIADGEENALLEYMILKPFQDVFMLPYSLKAIDDETAPELIGIDFRNQQYDKSLILTAKEFNLIMRQLQVVLRLENDAFVSVRKPERKILTCEGSAGLAYSYEGFIYRPVAEGQIPIPVKFNITGLEDMTYSSVANLLVKRFARSIK